MALEIRKCKLPKDVVSLSSQGDNVNEHAENFECEEKKQIFFPRMYGEICEGKKGIRVRY